MIDAVLMYQVIYDVYQKCGIKSFPIDCFQILNTYNIACKTYSSQNSLHKCLSISNDAFTARNTIFYNDTMPECRIAFSLMHEFAHYIMNIPDGSRKWEDDADCFASNILAPRIMIHCLLDRHDADQIHNTFGLSYAASNIAVKDYKKWLTVISCRKPAKIKEVEQKIYCLFRPEKRVESKKELQPLAIQAVSPRADVIDEFSKRHIDRLRRERKKLTLQTQKYEEHKQFLLKYTYNYNDFQMAEDIRLRFEELSL